MHRHAVNTIGVTSFPAAATRGSHPTKKQLLTAYARADASRAASLLTFWRRSRPLSLHGKWATGITKKLRDNLLVECSQNEKKGGKKRVTA